MGQRAQAIVTKEKKHAEKQNTSNIIKYSNTNITTKQQKNAI